MTRKGQCIMVSVTAFCYYLEIQVKCDYRMSMSLRFILYLLL